MMYVQKHYPKKPETEFDSWGRHLASVAVTFLVKPNFKDLQQPQKKKQHLMSSIEKVERNEQTCLRETQNPSEIIHPNTHFF